MMCKNRPVCQHCFLAHHSDRHRYLHKSCSTLGHCDLHDTRKCYNCSAISHFAVHDQCPTRTSPCPADPGDDQTKVNNPTTSGKHQTRPHLSRYSPPLAGPSNPPPKEANYEELRFLHRTLRNAQRLDEPTPAMNDVLAEIRGHTTPPETKHPNHPEPTEGPHDPR